MSAKNEPANAAQATEGTSSAAARQRGPVEEVIAKRMKQLGKKLQRYRTYASADPSALNADQRGALASLPALEGAYKELEELVREKGPVEEQELIQAAKLREATEAAKAAAIAESGQSVAQYKKSLATPLAYFLRLHALLHPVRPSDHQHLTFGHLTLPIHLQDEVQATDVLRVARMMEDLTLGGEEATAVLDNLVAGPLGDDEENDHVHHLIELLRQPEPVVESAAYTPDQTTSVEKEVDVEYYTEVAAVESVEATLEVSPGDAIVAEEAANDKSAQGSLSFGVINFLQADELAEPHATEEEVVEPVEAAAKETAPQQPSAESSAALTGESTPAPAPAFAPSTGNWADLDEEEAIAATPLASGVDGAFEAASTPASNGSSQQKSNSRAKGQKKTSQRKPRQPKQSKDGKDGETVQVTSNAATNDNKENKPRERNQKRERKAPPADLGNGPKVDNDGFEKVKKHSLPVRGGAAAGGRPRGEGQGQGRGGVGRPRGRGKGAGGSGTRSPAGDGQVKEPKPKPSILKAVQPTGPKSAPIL